MTGESERLAILETKVLTMERGYEQMAAKLEEMDRQQLNGFNTINLHLSEMNNQINLWKGRWDWFSKLTLSILTAVIVGLIMLWIKGT